MKKLFFLAAMASIGMLAACSDDNVVESVENSVDTAFDKDGNAWVKLGINLPNVPVTRGIGDYGNDYGNFNDGDANEYTVENAILAVFTAVPDATSELDYKLISSYGLSSGEWNVNGSTQITSNREFVQQINNAGAVGDLYAYVILNRHKFFEVKDKTHLYFYSGKVGAPEGGVDLTGLTLAEMGNIDLKESGRRYDANSFLMTNMPYATSGGGNNAPADGVVVKTLYPISREAIYGSQAAAEIGTAVAEVNVERVLAKVETKWTYPASGTEVRPDDPSTPEDEQVLADGSHLYTEDGNAYPVEVLGWFIDNTNPNTYVAHHFNDTDAGISYLNYNNTASNTYRFIAGAPASTGAYRIFWSVDNNYHVKAGTSGSDALINEGGKPVDTRLMEYDATGANVGGRLRANGSHYYCTENTFDVAHQTEYNTTRVVVAADFGAPFYTIAQEPNVKYDNTGIANYVKARISERVSFLQWVADYLKGGVDGVQFITINVTDPVDANSALTAGKVTVAMVSNADGLEETHIKAGKTLEQATTAFARMVNGDPGVLTGHNEYLNEFFNDNANINYYHEGVAYYHALIKHFGDFETPWDYDAHANAGVSNDVNGVYDADGEGNLDENKYLGRYGVVRNNWYNLDITGIRQIGSAVVPELPGTDPDTPDDQVENYLKVKINIMPWAIRKQTVKL